MIEKDPTNWGVATWLLVMGTAVAGGIVNWYHRVKAGHTRICNIIELIGELFTSGFVGFVVFSALLSIDAPVGVCAAASGISGHMATRMLILAEQWIEARASSEIKKAKK